MNTATLGWDCISLDFTREESEAQRRYTAVKFPAIKMP